MPKPTSKSRQELRSRFVRNAIPTEADFADLIAASLNQADDGVLKLPEQPLGLVRQKPDQPVLRFFADPAAEGSVWQVQLGAGDKPGFGLAAADGKLALFVDGATGNVGIGTDNLGAKLHIAHTNQDPGGGALILGPISQSNLRLGYNQGYSWIQSHGSKPLSINAIGNNVGIGTVNPGNKLTIQGNFNESKDPEGGIANGGLLALKGNAPQIDFIDTEHGDWAIHVNEGRMYFIREPWEHQDLVLDGRGNIGIGSSVPQAKLNIREITGTPATALKGTLLLDHEDAGGASSIVFSSRVNRGSDYAFIEYRDRNAALPLDPNVPHRGEASLLTIGVQNDAEDHIALLPSGNVGIGTTTPTCKLDVNGNAYISGSLGIRAGCEIMFSDDGQIRSKDDCHRILFRRNDSKMELREYGDIVFSSGSTGGQETSKMVIHGSGNVGIGTTNPEFKLDVNGTVRLGGFTTEEKDEWPNIVWCRDLAKGWDEGLYKHGKHYGFFGRAGFGVHIHESRSFELFSTMARPLLGVEGGSGNTSIRGQTNILTGANPIRFSSVWTAFPDDKTNGAEICNDTSGHKTLMIVGNKSNGGARRVSIWDILEVNGTCMANGSFQVNNNGNTFKIDTLADRAIFTLTKAFHGPGRQISWDGDNNWDQYSDETLKTNINIETGILPRLLQIDVKSFQWKDDLESKNRQLGFIAQDVRSAFPDLVKEKPFGDQSLMSLNYTNFGILAVGAIKELNAIMTTKIQELRIEIEDLKRQIGA